MEIGLKVRIKILKHGPREIARVIASTFMVNKTYSEKNTEGFRQIFLVGKGYF